MRVRKPRCNHATRLKIKGECYGCVRERLEARLSVADDQRATAHEVLDQMLWHMRHPSTATVAAKPTAKEEIEHWAESVALELREPLDD